MKLKQVNYEIAGKIYFDVDSIKNRALGAMDAQGWRTASLMLKNRAVFAARLQLNKILLEVELLYRKRGKSV